jgi:hypothetical protein
LASQGTFVNAEFRLAETPARFDNLLQGLLVLI